MKRILRWIWGVLEVFIIIYAIFITSCILCRNKYGFTQFNKMTFVTITEENQKYLPDYQVDDLLIVREQKTNLNVGDVVYYYMTVNEEYIVRSGVISSKTEDDYNAMYVLNDTDKTTVPATRVLGKFSTSYSSVGGVLDFLESQIGFLFFVLLPIMIVFIYQVYQFVIVLRYEKVMPEDLEDGKKKEKDTDLSKEKVEDLSSNNVVSDSKEEKNVDSIPVQEPIHDSSSDSNTDTDDIELL